MALQVRRGTNAERLGITPAAGELIFTTDTKQLYVGDGTTAGGITSIAGTIDSLLADTTPQLGGTLDLNNHDITGTGNINITGTIQASGNINLGDGVGSDVINIGGVMSGDLVPNADATHDLGSTTAYWKEAFLSQLTVDSQITAERVQADIIADDSTVVFNAATGQIAAAQVSGTFTGNVTGNATGAHAGTFDGEVTGSVFGDDSTVLVDGISSKIVGEVTGIINTTEVTITGVGDINSSARLEFVYNEAPADNSTTLATHRVMDRTQQKFVMQTRPTNTYFSHDDSGAAGTTMYNSHIVHGGLKVKIEPANSDFAAPVEALEVLGNIKGTGFVQFGSLTTVQRDALTAVNGMVIYNTTDNKFQGYESGAWANLI
jgi:hypothetical protein